MSGILREVRPHLIEAARMSGSCSKVRKEFKENGYCEMSLEVLAQLRTQEGHSAKISTDGGYVAEWIIYAPEQLPRLVRPFLTLAGINKAVNDHEKHEEFYVSKKQYARALQNSIEIFKEHTDIDTTSFGNNPSTVWMFGRNNSRTAKAYGEFLRTPVGSEQMYIERMRIELLEADYVCAQKRPFARKVWIGGLSENSVVDCTLKGLDMSNMYWGARVLHAREIIRE